jgi:predicted metal-dependent enzyme (double-stranded beta helix superfamily)
MDTVMAYELTNFCNDCRSALADHAVPQGDTLDRVRTQLAKLVANDSFALETCGPAATPGLHLLYEDGPLGFQVLAHVNQKPRISPPHNHGTSWAVYGQVTGHTDMTEYRRVDDGSDPAHARLEVIRTYRLQAGEVGVYQRGVIHSIDYPAGSRFIRVTGTNLDRIERDAFDLATGEIRRPALPQAS